MEKKRLIAGRNPVFEYLRSSKTVAGTLYLNATAHGNIIDDIKEEAKKRGVRISSCSKEELASMYTSGNDQGVLLALKTSINKDVDEKDLLDKVSAEKGVLVLLDQLTDPHNIGAIIRSAEALGADGVCMPRAHAPDLNATIVKSSAGATAHIPICMVANAARFIDLAKDRDFWVIGTDGGGTTKLSELSSIRPALVVIGSEGSGMRRLTSDKCDYTVSIPLRGMVTSLNASVAAGIVLFHVLNTDN